MKFVLRDLKTGDRLRGKVAEILAGDEVLISFDGDLIRARNETARPLVTGQSVVVTVTAVAPLRFQLLGSRRTGRLDVNV
jgi:membrane protein implicated in regulation of membrane protease activity